MSLSRTPDSRQAVIHSFWNRPGELLSAPGRRDGVRPILISAGTREGSSMYREKAESTRKAADDPKSVSIAEYGICTLGPCFPRGTVSRAASVGHLIGPCPASRL